ncbi:MAG: 2-C-methyl-D-erythritol 4-phosphate cytidylyltransferase [Thermoleophilia bacterium]|nr:2-C-methyl-D-erythritol 4-phosphate cytidylyltransferase [Thermoleophilia bacterium]
MKFEEARGYNANRPHEIRIRAKLNLGIIIAAGGAGSRMRAGASKQLLKLAGEPVLARTIGIFEPLSQVSEIVVAIDTKNASAGRRLISDRGFAKVKAVVAGGEHRAASVINAFRELSPEIDAVAVHDGARPLFPGELLREGLARVNEEGVDGAVFGLPVIDTIKETEPESLWISGTPERGRLWAAQTPQIFRRAILEQAFALPPEILEKATDDSYLVERIGGRVVMVPGSRENIKLTEPLDVLMAEEILIRRGE